MSQYSKTVCAVCSAQEFVSKHECAEIYFLKSKIPTKRKRTGMRMKMYVMYL